MKVRFSNTLRILSAAAILVGTSGAAMAQSSSDGNFKKPLRAGRAAPAPAAASRSTMVMRQDDGQNTIELRVEGGEYSAKLNGKEVPQDRIIHEKDEVRILDKDGDVVSTFHMSMDEDGAVGESGEAQPPQPPKAPKAPKAQKGARGAGGATNAMPMQPALPANPPKVMLGITMDAPSESLIKNYSLKEGEAILVSRVSEGLPADKAGLKENDIITEIDGKKPVNQEILREVLRSKEPGDTIEFTVLRKGGDKSIRITLDKYDQDKLSAGLNLAPGEGGVTLWNNGDEDGDANKQTEKAFREAMKNQQQWRSFTMPDGGQGKAFVFGGNGPDMDKKLAELDKKMADLDKKLEQVDAQMTKLQALIEKLSEQHGK